VERTPILIIEDEERIATMVARTLDATGFAVTVAQTGLAGLRRLKAQKYPLVILDLLLPDLHGFSVLRTALANEPGQQVLVLSAVSDAHSRVHCLELGACDYLAKPFDLAELLARIRIRLESRRESLQQLTVGEISLDLQRRVADKGGKRIPLASREFLLLEYLMRKGGEVATREELLEHVWDYQFDPGTNVIDVCVARLRQKLGCDCIETVRNVGYFFVGS
jgi:DNA-binding response OmpR family regulator